MGAAGRRCSCSPASTKVYHPAKAVAHMKRVDPHVRFEVIAGAGHDLPLVKAAAVNAKVVEFLER